MDDMGDQGARMSRIHQCTGPSHPKAFCASRASKHASHALSLPQPGAGVSLGLAQCRCYQRWWQLPIASWRPSPLSAQQPWAPLLLCLQCRNYVRLFTPAGHLCDGFSVQSGPNHCCHLLSLGHRYIVLSCSGYGVEPRLHEDAECCVCPLHLMVKHNLSRFCLLLC